MGQARTPSPRWRPRCPMHPSPVCPPCCPPAAPGPSFASSMYHCCTHLRVHVLRQMSRPHLCRLSGAWAPRSRHGLCLWGLPHCACTNLSSRPGRPSICLLPMASLSVHRCLHGPCPVSVSVLSPLFPVSLCQLLSQAPLLPATRGRRGRGVTEHSGG